MTDTVKLLLPTILVICFPIFIFLMFLSGKQARKMTDEQATIQSDIARNLDRIATALEKRQG